MLSKIEALKSLEDADELESEIGRLESRIESVKYEHLCAMISAGGGRA